MAKKIKNPPPFHLALVTGANSGLGFELCQILSKNGVSLILTARDRERLDFAAKLPPVVETIETDLGEDRTKLIEAIRKHAPDLVINCAGFGLYGPLFLYSTKEQLKILEVDAAAAIEISIEAARVLREQRKEGVVLNVSSLAGELPIPTMALYAAAKACLTSFSKSFDAEMRPYGIRILAALPGPIDTGFATRASNNGYVQKSTFALKKERAALAIWKQIQKRKAVQVIDWRCRLGLLLLQFLPRFITDKILRNSLKDRFK